MKERLLKRFASVFKEVLGPEDRINVEPVRLTIDEESNVTPLNVKIPYDVPHNLRSPADRELRAMIEAGIIEKVEHSTKWCSKSFFVKKPNSDPPKARFVTDFRRLNSALRRPVWSTESSSQLLRHLNPNARVWACLDASSGYHPVPVAEQDRDLLTVCTQLGRWRFACLSQGVTSSSDWFNIVTDVDLRFKSDVYKKNQDDVLIEGSPKGEMSAMEALEKHLVEFLEHCKAKNIKLSPKNLPLGKR